MNLKKLRKSLHHEAEKSGEEHRTRDLLMNVLDKHKGTVIKGHDGISLYVHYDFKKEKTIMIRAEMDGLTIDGKVLHACGHDGHMAILCGLSERLSSLEDFGVNVLLLFQSSEETGAGAKQILSDPQFLKICPDEAIALHVYPDYKPGFYVKNGVMCASGRELNGWFAGDSGHCALRKKNTALKQAVDFLSELHEMQFENGFLSVNVIRSGFSRNQVDKCAYIEGTMRTLTSSAEKRIMDWVSFHHGHFEWSDGYPVLVNHSQLVKRAFSCGAQRLSEPLWICDDFAFYSQCIPSVYILMGADSKIPLHHSDFEFDDDLIESAVCFLLKMLENP